MARQIRVYDTTLRDGTQGEGVSFSMEDKVRLAQRLDAPGKPTVLVYGHYDVQPARKEDGWDGDPFEPVRRDGNLIARGATDDKGQFLTVAGGTVSETR